LNETVEVEMKFVPFTVIVPLVGSCPTGVLEGESEEIVGTGLLATLIVNVAATKEGPPGKGFTTVICGNPVLAMYAAGMLTESCVVLTLYVATAHVVEGGAAVTQLPFQKTREVVMKPVPESVRVKDPPPATAPSGESEVIVGVGVNVDPLLPQELIIILAIPTDKTSTVRRKPINPCLL
jgi:hypothetical protein